MSAYFSHSPWASPLDSPLFSSETETIDVIWYGEKRRKRRKIGSRDYGDREISATWRPRKADGVVWSKSKGPRIRENNDKCSSPKAGENGCPKPSRQAGRSHILSLHSIQDLGGMDAATHTGEGRYFTVPPTKC